MTTRRPSTRRRGCHAGWSSTRRSTASDRVRPIAASAGDGVARGSRRGGGVGANGEALPEGGRRLGGESGEV